jgi:hypothetical protein
MKTRLLTLLAFTLLSSAFAQKCTFNKNEKNAETGVLEKHIMNTINNQFVIWTNNDGGNYKIGLELTTTELRKENIKKGDTLTIMLSNDDFIFATANDKYPPVGKADEMLEATTYFPFYTIKPDDWIKLSKTTITLVKVNFGSTYANYEIPEKKAKKLTESFNCVR